jgi:hypothetical protein
MRKLRRALDRTEHETQTADEIEGQPTDMEHP